MTDAEITVDCFQHGSRIMDAPDWGDGWVASCRAGARDQETSLNLMLILRAMKSMQRQANTAEEDG